MSSEVFTEFIKSFLDTREELIHEGEVVDGVHVHQVVETFREDVGKVVGNQLSLNTCYQRFPATEKFQNESISIYQNQVAHDRTSSQR